MRDVPAGPVRICCAQVLPVTERRLVVETLHENKVSERTDIGALSKVVDQTATNRLRAFGKCLRSIARDTPVLARERDAISLARQECASGVDTEFTSGCTSTHGASSGYVTASFRLSAIAGWAFYRIAKKPPFFRFTSRHDWGAQDSINLWSALP